mmetsp:Transcript_30696/g.91905  ORF Transcript_30696/g.91905 Transcript_30696/m.91905 type:complete len:218 (+) Transcript_30696:1898-2551(+)
MFKCSLAKVAMETKKSHRPVIRSQAVLLNQTQSTLQWVVHRSLNKRSRRVTLQRTRGKPPFLPNLRMIGPCQKPRRRREMLVVQPKLTGQSPMGTMPPLRSLPGKTPQQRSLPSTKKGQPARKSPRPEDIRSGLASALPMPMFLPRCRRDFRAPRVSRHWSIRRASGLLRLQLAAREQPRLPRPQTKRGAGQCSQFSRLSLTKLRRFSMGSRRMTST